jgi:hypothetical protein
MLTNTQLLTLKAAILANPDLTVMVTAGATGTIAQYLRGYSTFIVWQSNTPTSDVYDAILWSKMTPADAPDGSLMWQCRSLACQGKQFNLQTLLQGREVIKSNKVSIRDGLQDALTLVPSGVGGITVSAGWPAVRLAMQRPASQFEKIFATGTGTAASPGNLVLEGGPDDYDVVQALFQI